MPYKPNVVFEFVDYEVTDEGIILHFVSPDPGPGMENDYYILVTDAELAGVTNLSEFRDLVETKLKRRIRKEGIASKLDPYIGREITIP